MSAPTDEAVAAAMAKAGAMYREMKAEWLRHIESEDVVALAGYVASGQMDPRELLELTFAKGWAAALASSYARKAGPS